MSDSLGDYRDARTKMDRLRIAFATGGFFRDAVLRERSDGYPTALEVDMFLAGCLIELEERLRQIDERLKAEEQFRSLLTDNANPAGGSCSRG